MTSRYSIIVAISVYLATGLFVVPANEKAIVRRFGRAVLPLRSSGLHFDFPWPLSRIDRVNFNEVRTITVGDTEADLNFLQSTATARTVAYLTGDKNLMLIRISVQYRVSEQHVFDWLYRCESPVQRLRLLVDTTIGDLVSRSGVDFVHTEGLAQFNNRLLHDVQTQVTSLRLGCEIEQVTVERSEPPARVKLDFLDVSNARADMSRSIQDAKTDSEKTVAESEANVRKQIDDAERVRQSAISRARGSADRFLKLVNQISDDAMETGRTYSDSRQIVINRLTLESISDALQKSKLKVVLEGDQRFDFAFPQTSQ